MAHDQHLLSIVCLALIAITILATFPFTVLAEERKSAVDQSINHGIPDELQLLKEEETVSVASRYEQPKISQTFVGPGRCGGPAWKVNAGLLGEWDNGLSREATVYYVTAATYPVIETYQTLAPFGATELKSCVDAYTLLNLRDAYRFWKQQAAGGYVRDAEVEVSAFSSLNNKHKEHPLDNTIGS